jgi:hypothetical protein
MPESLTRQGLARFGEAAATHVGDDKVPRLVALVATGDQVHVEVLGSLAIGGAPVRRESLFRIALTIKPITGAATLALVREQLDSPICQHDFVLGWLACYRSHKLGTDLVYMAVDRPEKESIYTGAPVRDALSPEPPGSPASRMVYTPPRERTKMAFQDAYLLGLRGDKAAGRALFPADQRPGGFYGRCRACRNMRARERYWSDPEITEAERERARRNARQRATRVRQTTSR